MSSPCTSRTVPTGITSPVTPPSTRLDDILRQYHGTDGSIYLRFLGCSAGTGKDSGSEEMCNFYCLAEEELLSRITHRATAPSNSLLLVPYSLFANRGIRESARTRRDNLPPPHHPPSSNQPRGSFGGGTTQDYVVVTLAADYVATTGPVTV